MYALLADDMEQTIGDACGKARRPRPRKVREHLRRLGGSPAASAGGLRNIGYKVIAFSTS